jgi:hypothetical protein
MLPKDDSVFLDFGIVVLPSLGRAIIFVWCNNSLTMGETYHIDEVKYLYIDLGMSVPKAENRVGISLRDVSGGMSHDLGGRVWNPCFVLDLT